MNPTDSRRDITFKQYFYTSHQIDFNFLDPDNPVSYNMNSMIHSRFSGRNISLQLELVKLDILFLYKRITTRYSSANFEFAN